MRRCLAGVCLAAILAGCAETPQNQIRLALAVPLTGDVAAMGQGMKRGMELAVAEANAANRFGGKQVVLEAFDDRADPKEAVSVANRIVADRRILGVVGHLNSGCSIPASQVYARRGLAMISPASTNPKLTQQGLGNVFRVCTTDDVQGAVAAEFSVQSLGAKSLAILHDKTAYGQGLAESFQKRALALGAAVSTFDGIDLGDKDFKALLTRIKSKNPQLIYFGGMYTEGGLLAKQSRELGLQIPICSGDGLFTPEFIKIGGRATEGDYATMMGVAPDNLPQAKKFVQQFKAQYPGIDMQPYDAYTYESANLLMAALEKAGMNASKAAESLARIRYEGILGVTTFDDKGDTLNKTISIYQVQNGAYVFVK